MPGLETAFPAASAVQAGLGAIQTVVGLINNGKAKREAAKLEATRPKYAIKDGVRDNLSLAGSELMNGMGARAENAYNQANDRALGTSVDAILRGGGSVNNIADAYGSSDEGRMRLAQLQDSMRLNQIKNYMDSSTAMANAQDTAWAVNEDAVWKDKAQAVAQQRQAAQNMIMGGMNTAGQGVMGGLNTMAGNRAYNSMLGLTGSAGAAPVSAGGQTSSPTIIGGVNAGNTPSVPTFGSAPANYNWASFDNGTVPINPNAPAFPSVPNFSFADFSRRWNRAQ